MKNALYVILALLILISGCRSRKQEAPRFYLIEFPSEFQASDTIQPLPFVLEIEDVDIHPAYSTNQIAMRENDHEVKYFIAHQWASRPQQSVQRFISNYFHQNRIFETTNTRFWNDQPDYRLETIVNHIEVVRIRKDFYARLHVRFTLIDANNQLVDQHNFDQKRLLERRNLNLFTTAVNNMLYEELNFFAQRIHFQLKPAD